MGSSKIRKCILLITSIISITILINYFLDHKAKAFEIYLGDTVIGYNKDKTRVKDEYIEIIDGINNRLADGEALEKKRLSFKRVYEDVNLSTYDELKNDILNSMDNNVTLKSLVIDKNNVGYVIDENQVEEVLREVSKSYIKENNIDSNKVKEINIKGDIKLKDEKVSISKLNSSKEISNKIINENNKDLLEVELVVQDKLVLDIEPSVKIERSDDLPLGESYVKDEGKRGKKEQSIETTYINNKKKETEVLSENVISSSESKVIYKGTKNPITSNTAFLTRPTRGGVITSSFGERWGKNHNGIDIAGKTGDSVSAAFDGKVKSAFYERDGYGNVVILDHGDGLETRYAHMDSIEVKEGDTVKKGELVGKVGSTGRSTGPHLHFELRANGKPIDPNGYIN